MMMKTSNENNELKITKKDLSKGVLAFVPNGILVELRATNESGLLLCNDSDFEEIV